jgi:hypothetical protein
MSITLDSITYDVPITIVRRTVDKLNKSAERTQDGTLYKETIGNYYNIAVECGQSSNNASDYSALWLKLSDPSSEFYTITNAPGVPSPYGTYECYIENVAGEMYRYQKDGVDYFRKLTFSIIQRSPARTP